MNGITPKDQTMHEPSPTYLSDYTPPDFLIDSVDLCFDLTEEVTTVTSTLKIKRNGSHQKPLILDGEELKLLEVSLDGEMLDPSRYQLEKETLRILDVLDQFTLKIKNQITPQTNTRLMGIFKSGSLFCSQCEPQGFRRITYFIDRPDVLSHFTVTIEADKTRYPVLLSNGNLVAQGELENGRHWVKWIDPFKKPSYLFALVAGNLDCLEGSYKTQSGRNVVIRIFSDKGQRDRCQFALESVYKAMQWDEQVFGREYDLDIFMIVAVNDFNMGAMENKGLNIFNAKYILANPKTATDIDFQAILGVVGHEYFHNWSGNRVTCRDWFQLSLKEGLTIFRDQEFSADMSSRLVTRINDVKVIRTVQFAEDAGPMAHPVQPDSYIEINNFYTTTVYNKGAEVIRMMRTLLGPVKFREAMDLYFARNDGKAVTIEEFVKAMEDAASIDLAQFRRWYKQSGTPLITINAAYSPSQKTFSLKVAQTCPPTPNQPHKEPFHIPLAMGLLSARGEELPLTLENDSVPYTEKTRVLSLQKPEEIFYFKGIEESPILSALRGFSAPVKVSIEYSDEDLLFLSLYDTDGFSRWEACQEIALKTIRHLVRQYQLGFDLTVNDDLFKVFEKIVEDKTLDKAFAAELLTLPSEAYIGEQMEFIDVDAIYTARQYLRKALAEKFQSHFLHVYRENHKVGEYQYDLISVAERSLKNACMSYLIALSDPEMIELCWEQMRHANNMTDSLNALSLLASVDSDRRTAALDLFYQQWQDDTLVLDKWFTVQARSELPNTLLAVKSLMNHPKFDNKNPNKLRALIGSFCQSNRVQFHAKNGEGYEFLTDEVCRLNHINPQVASRLLEPLTQWRRYDVHRQEKMRSCLEKIKALPELSRDIYELVDKSLSFSK